MSVHDAVYWLAARGMYLKLCIQDGVSLPLVGYKDAAVPVPAEMSDQVIGVEVKQGKVVRIVDRVYALGEGSGVTEKRTRTA